MAMAIQGLTPDIHDVASVSLLEMLYPGANDSKLGRGPTSTPDCDQDELPDDVCVPDRPASKGLRRSIQVLPWIVILPVLTGERLSWSGRLRTSATRNGIARNEDLTLSLCRLIC
jgi:hypothetical protein